MGYKAWGWGTGGRVRTLQRATPRDVTEHVCLRHLSWSQWTGRSLLAKGWLQQGGVKDRKW